MSLSSRRQLRWTSAIPQDLVHRKSQSPESQPPNPRCERTGRLLAVSRLALTPDPISNCLSLTRCHAPFWTLPDPNDRASRRPFSPMRRHTYGGETPPGPSLGRFASRSHGRVSRRATRREVTAFLPHDGILSWRRGYPFWPTATLSVTGWAKISDRGAGGAGRIKSIIGLIYQDSALSDSQHSPSPSRVPEASRLPAETHSPG
jgi:hypothetical protein